MRSPPSLSKLLREKPRTIWYNTVKARPIKVKLYGAILEWQSRSGEEIKDSIDLQCHRDNILMCLLAINRHS